ncbi:pyridoxamine 5'-phosphate oxidase family protein [Breznakia pachnodae]|uniref:Pyridoxamine 5'-phosphate oxidase family protein n=1 Tax=Breznakia pachnodae TaxID=265178 RepID=A0ABU0E4Z4_9FIRM|nr:pyridoxamine 5'-phosphate oxidase family protein [Breznakia pachnodae]MDQ0361763.1 putative pyridoxamine 5'-phosphate oxidase family protein [Breznakia pachnodae]
MIDFVSFLSENPNGVLATQDGVKVKTRVFQYLFADNNKVYFCTSNQKPVYEQLKNEAYASFCTYPNNFSKVISVNGSVTFVDDLALKTRALDENPGIKAIYETPKNPVFEIFYIDAEEIETFSFTDGPITYTL